MNKFCELHGIFWQCEYSLEFFIFLFKLYKNQAISLILISIIKTIFLKTPAIDT